MKTIPQRFSDSSGRTYVAHCACTADAPHRAAAAFLDQKDRYRPYRAETERATPLRAYLSLMRAILETVGAEADKTYIFFYPADTEIALSIREALAANREHLDDRETDADWTALRHAYYAQRCGCSVLDNRRGLGTGSTAAIRALTDTDVDDDASAQEGDGIYPMPAEDDASGPLDRLL